MTEIRLWGVLGRGNVGKSTTVGHLIGAFGPGKNGLGPRRGGVYDVLLRGGGSLQIEARRQSLQEGRKSPQKQVEIFDRLLKRRAKSGHHLATLNLLLALRTDLTNNLPKADTYLSYFLKVGWHIESLALIAPSSAESVVYRRFGVSTCCVDRSPGIGWMVGQVRNHFGWA